MSPPATEAVVVERRGAVSWATLSRPERANACGSDVMAGLEEWLAGAADADVRVLVLTGSGSTFCAGADLKEAGRLVADREALLGFLRRGRDLVTEIQRTPVPVLAAVNGAAYAGGLELLLACDIAVAAGTASIGDRHISQGQVPGWGASAMLPRVVGQTVATRLMLTGETLTGDQAAAAGLVSEAVPAEQLTDRVTRLAEGLAALDRGAVERMLRLTRRVPADLASGLQTEWEVLLEHVSAAQTLSRAAAF